MRVGAWSSAREDVIARLRRVVPPVQPQRVRRRGARSGARRPRVHGVVPRRGRGVARAALRGLRPLRACRTGRATRTSCWCGSAGDARAGRREPGRRAASTSATDRPAARLRRAACASTAGLVAHTRACLDAHGGGPVRRARDRAAHRARPRSTSRLTHRGQGPLHGAHRHPLLRPHAGARSRGTAPSTCR